MTSPARLVATVGETIKIVCRHEMCFQCILPASAILLIPFFIYSCNEIFADKTSQSDPTLSAGEDVAKNFFGDSTAANSQVSANLCFAFKYEVLIILNPCFFIFSFFVNILWIDLM